MVACAVPAIGMIFVEREQSSTILAMRNPIRQPLTGYQSRESCSGSASNSCDPCPRRKEDRVAVFELGIASRHIYQSLLRLKQFSSLGRVGFRDQFLDRYVGHRHISVEARAIGIG